MKKTISALVVAASVAFAPSAQAQFALDLRLAYAIPMGDATLNSPLSDTISGALPIGLDARYKFTPNISAGLYFQYAPAFVKDSFCTAGTISLSCSGTGVRLGLEAMYEFMPDGGVNPWISLGTGWEWATVKASSGGVSVSLTANGWEYFNVQGGVDFPISKMFALGPYIGFSGGTYTSATNPVTDASESIPSEERAFHSWFQFGVKGTLNL